MKLKPDFLSACVTRVLKGDFRGPLQNHKFNSIFFTVHGLPAAIQLAGTSFVTTLTSPYNRAIANANAR